MTIAMNQDLDIRERREKMRAASRIEAESIMHLAGLDITRTWELANTYWPDSPIYDEVRTPWWLFMTGIGPVQIGWRKRVLHIDWAGCAYRGIVTTDDVTKGDTYVHAWSVEKAVEYVRALARAAKS